MDGERVNELESEVKTKVLQLLVSNYYQVKCMTYKKDTERGKKKGNENTWKRESETALGNVRGKFAREFRLYTHDI